MGSDVGQIFPTASLHRDHSISCALVCEKIFFSRIKFQLSLSGVQETLFPDLLPMTPFFIVLAELSVMQFRNQCQGYDGVFIPLWYSNLTLNLFQLVADTNVPMIIFNIQM